MLNHQIRNRNLIVSSIVVRIDGRKHALLSGSFSSNRALSLVASSPPGLLEMLNNASYFYHMDESGFKELAYLNFNKVCAIVFLAVSVIIFEFLPWPIIRRGSGYVGRVNNLWLDHLLRAGGGVLLATTYIHLLPEVREGVEKLQEANKMPKWPVEIAELIMCIGFFLMYGTEEMVHRCLSNDDHGHRSAGHNHHDDGTALGEQYFNSTDDYQRRAHSLRLSDSTPLSLRNDHVYGSMHSGLQLTQHQSPQNRKCSSGHIKVDPDRPLRGILLVIAVSIHQVFEGAAVGLEKNVKEMWTLLGAVAAHKLIIAICVGAEILSGGASVFVQAICLFVFAIASPIGVGLGMGMSSGESLSMDFASTILQGLATGTLMFVVFFEILSKSEERGVVRITQYLATLVGFLIMLLLLCFLDS